MFKRSLITFHSAAPTLRRQSFPSFLPLPLSSIKEMSTRQIRIIRESLAAALLFVRRAFHSKDIEGVVGCVVHGARGAFSRLQFCCSPSKAPQTASGKTCHCCSYRQSFARLITPIMRGVEGDRNVDTIHQPSRFCSLQSAPN
jgi:hypothetical protein